jgi:hypothetical protein
LYEVRIARCAVEAYERVVTPALDRRVHRVLRLHPTDGPGVYQNFGEHSPSNCHYILEISHDRKTVQIAYMVDQVMRHTIIVAAWLSPFQVQ